MATAARPNRPGLVDRVRRAGAAALKKVFNQRKTLPPSPFIDWEYQEASDAINKVLQSQTIDTSGSLMRVAPAPGDATYSNPRQLQDPIEMNRAFFNGDHWQGGAGWIGPHPLSGEAGFNDAMREIALAFTSQNAVREVVKRHASGVVGKQWQWSFVPRRPLSDDEEPTKEELAAIDEATGLMRQWLLARKIPSLVRDAVCTVLLAERAAIRLYVPGGLAEETPGGASVVNAASIEEALGLIWPEHPMPEHASVVSDDDTKLECGVWLYEADEDDDDKPEEYAGMCFLDEDGKTIMRLAPQRAEEGAVESDLDLGGRIPMFEMRRTALITPQVQQAQRALNLALSMVPRNVISGGFLERILLNAQMPGHFELDATGQKTGRFIPDQLYLGAGSTNFFKGAEEEDADGNTTLATPSAVFREPIEPNASIAATDKHYHSILEETGQLHTIMSGDANASGKSRVEARAEYLTTLQETQPEAEAAIRFIIETAMAMAEALANTPGKYTSVLRAQAQCRLDAGPLSDKERVAIQDQIGKTLGQDTAMALLGVDDVDAERSRMNSDPQARANLGKVVGDALLSLTAAGASLEGAARFIGIDQTQLTDLLTGERFTPGTPGNPDVQPQLDASGNPIPPDNGPPPKPPKNGPPPPKPKPAPNEPQPAKPPARQGSGSGSAAGGS